MTLKIIFLVLSAICGGATGYLYKKGDEQRDNFGLGLLCLASLVLTVIFALCAALTG